MESCDCDQIEMSSRKDTVKRTPFERRILRPALFSPPPRPQTIPWSFAPGTFQPVNEWKPKFLEFVKESSRLKTFSTWPKQMNPKGAELARVGFFYEGVSDTCRCFFCGILVHNWEVKDDAFEEHLKHSPDCHYVEYLM